MRFRYPHRGSLIRIDFVNRPTIRLVFHIQTGDADHVRAIERTWWQMQLVLVTVYSLPWKINSMHLLRNFSNRLSIFDNKIDSSYIFSIPLYWFRLICIEDWIRICQEFFNIKYPLIIIGENNGIFLYYLYYILLYLIISCN